MGQADLCQPAYRKERFWDPCGEHSHVPTDFQIKSLVDRLGDIKGKIISGMDLATETAKALEDAEGDDDVGRASMGADQQDIIGIEKDFLRAVDQAQMIQLRIDVLQDFILTLRQRGEIVRLVVT
jgi:hypothetical protein